jgi:signal transduction histidine kinase
MDDRDREIESLKEQLREVGERAAALALEARFPEMNPGPVLRFDREGTVLLANAAARRLFGESELLGKRWVDICPGMTIGFWENVLRTTGPLSHEADFGGQCVMFAHVCSDTGDNIFTFGSDVTARRHDENLLAEQAARLAEVARFPDMNPGPVLRLSLDAIVLLANKAAVSVFGTELLGRCWRDVCPGIDNAVWTRIVNATGIVPIETRIGDKEFIFTHRPDIQGNLVFTYGTDVTRQRLAERALRQSEKMATLGTLAAGVAHELNNPAAATRRAAEQLREAFTRLEKAQLELSAVAVTAQGREVLQSLDREARTRATRPSELNALTRSDHEANVEEWLDEHDIEDPWDLAHHLVGQGLAAQDLDHLASTFPNGTLRTVLGWAASVFPVYALLNEISQASARIAEIVGALKGYSYLGQAPIQAVNLHEGLDNTLVILRNKLKAGITVHRDYCYDLPQIQAYGSELNQVWTNLLDNAAEAIGGKGEITIRTFTRGGSAFVEIEDNGPGIPEEIQSRVFDPFFTTKEPGKGTGLGLSTTYSIVAEKHRGTISVESRPGCTRFTVQLPIDNPAAGQSQAGGGTQ